jgi:ParB family chromosome partitioning protein
MVDGGRIALSPAVELSYLSSEEQLDLLETIESEDCTPSLSQAIRMRKLSAAGDLSMDRIFEILTEVKGNQVEYVKVPTKSIRSYFHRDATPQQITETILRAMDFYNAHLERQRRDRDAR